MTWIEPLALKTILVNVFSGSMGIFTAVSLMVIVGMAAYFRMAILMVFLMIGIFFMMFAGELDKNILMLIVVVGSALLGYWISKIVKSQ